MRTGPTGAPHHHNPLEHGPKQSGSTHRAFQLPETASKPSGLSSKPWGPESWEWQLTTLDNKLNDLCLKYQPADLNDAGKIRDELQTLLNALSNSSLSPPTVSSEIEAFNNVKSLLKQAIERADKADKLRFGNRQDVDIANENLTQVFIILPRDCRQAIEKALTWHYCMEDVDKYLQQTLTSWWNPSLKTESYARAAGLFPYLIQFLNERANQFGHATDEDFKKALSQIQEAQKLFNTHPGDDTDVKARQRVNDAVNLLRSAGDLLNISQFSNLSHV